MLIISVQITYFRHGSAKTGPKNVPTPYAKWMLCMYGPESRPLQASRSKTLPPQLKNNWFRTLSIDRLWLLRIFVLVPKEGIKWVNPVCIKKIITLKSVLRFLTELLLSFFRFLLSCVFCSDELSQYFGC